MPKKLPWILYFVGYWLLTMLLYRYGFGAGFVDDYISGIVQFEHEGWAGIADSYNFTSLYYGHNIAFYGYYAIFGSSAVAWFLLFTGLHSLNAALALAFLKRLFTNNQFPKPLLTALFISLVFLVSPYQTENVVWNATLHYGISMLCMWGMLWLYASYIDSGGWWKLAVCYLIFMSSLLTLEISVVFPGIMMLVFGLLWQPVNGLCNILRHIVPIALPMAIILGGYLVATYLLKGHFIGHYGESHLQFEVGQLLGAFWQYNAKLLGFVHFWDSRAFVYENLRKPLIAYGLLALLAVLWLMLRKHRPQYAWFALGWLGIIVITLLPVLNMFFIYIHNGENARLSYFPSLFIYGAPILLLVWFATRWMWFYGVAMLVIAIWLLKPQVLKWHYAVKMQEKAVDSPEFYGKGNVYLLNVPCFYDGVYVFRTVNRMYLAREYYGLPKATANLRYVMSANMHLPTDSVTVKKLDLPNTYKVEFSSWGNWFWYNRLGAVSRQENGLTITLDEWGLGYTLHIQNLQPEDRLLYFTPHGWSVVKPD